MNVFKKIYWKYWVGAIMSIVALFLLLGIINGHYKFIVEKGLINYLYIYMLINAKWIAFLSMLFVGAYAYPIEAKYTGANYKELITKDIIPLIAYSVLLAIYIIIFSKYSYKLWADNFELNSNTPYQYILFDYWWIPLSLISSYIIITALSYIWSYYDNDRVLIISKLIEVVGVFAFYYYVRALLMINIDYVNFLIPLLVILIIILTFWIVRFADSKRYSFRYVDLTYEEYKKYFVILSEDVQRKDNSGQSILFLAAKHDDVKNAQLLILKDCNINMQDNSGNTVLHIAVSYNSVNFIEYIGDYPKLVDLSNNLGETPLFLASFHNNTEIMKMLIDNGADIHCKNKYGHTALYSTVYFNSFEAFHILVNLGVDTNQRDNDGNTILHKAIRRNSVDMLKKICSYTDMDIQNKNGETALHMAISLGYRECAICLINEGANFCLANIYNETPYTLAQLKGDGILLNALDAKMQ